MEQGERVEAVHLERPENSAAPRAISAAWSRLRTYDGQLRLIVDLLVSVVGWLVTSVVGVASFILYGDLDDFVIRSAVVGVLGGTSAVFVLVFVICQLFIRDGDHTVDHLRRLFSTIGTSAFGGPAPCDPHVVVAWTFDVASIFLPASIANEELGDAREVIEVHLASGCSRWRSYRLALSAVLWASINAVRAWSPLRERKGA